VTELTGQVEQLAPMARKTSVFGDEVEPPEDATAFERLLAMTGRDPRAWAD